MTFVFPILLGGLVLAGIPVLLHLIMRQKPRHLLFPAFRFLIQRQRTNQRKLRLRHLLLLALRLVLIVALCFALARPKVFNERLNLSSDRPVAAVLVFDTSASMGYLIRGQSRLDEVKQRAQELLDGLPQGSRLAVLDTAAPGGEWLPSLSLARDRIAELTLHHANGPVTGRLAEAYRLFADLAQESDTEGEQPPRFIYVFSDRTQACWDAGRAKDLAQLRDRLGTEVHAVFVDVGTDKPVDVGLAAVDLPRQVIPTNSPLLLRVTARATGNDCDTEVVCRIDSEKTPERKPLKLGAGQSQVVAFERTGLTAGFHQAEITLATSDALPQNNSTFATFEVRGGRDVLAVADNPADATFWKWALEAPKAFNCNVVTTEEALRLFPDDLARFSAVCLIGVARPPQELWERLGRFVQAGGGLAIVPGGEETDRLAYESQPAQAVMPGRLVRVVQAADSAAGTWKEASYQHPILAPFREWSQNLNVIFLKNPPVAHKYWEVTPLAAHVIVSYGDAKALPALLEKNVDRTKTRGRVLLYTTALDVTHLTSQPTWNDYLATSFYLVLVNKTVGYLAGDADEAGLLFLAGQAPRVLLPAKPRFPTYTLQGPQLSPTDAVVSRADAQGELMLPQAVTPGNYTLLGGDGRRTASFSVNLPPDESLLSRVPPEQIEALFGPGAVLAVGHSINLQDALQGHWSQPLELGPGLLIALLFVLALENLLANRFYRRETPEAGETQTPRGESSQEP
jgi:hypothetical protein